MSDFESMDDAELYDQIVDEIETALDIDTNDLEIDVENGFITIWGSVPNIRDSEELEKLLFEDLGLEDVDFDVVIDEGMQTTTEAMDDSARSREDFDLGSRDLGGGSGGGGGGEFDDFSEPGPQI